MKNTCILIILCFIVSCGQKLIEQPEGLIAKGQMENILYDIAIITAAKNTNSETLRKNNIETMSYIYTKYDIDSVQFVESDVYYASMPTVYEAIYTTIEARLEKEKIAIEAAKKEQDSIKQAKAIAKRKLETINDETIRAERIN